MTWDTSCRDWEQRLLAGRTLVPDLPLFDPVAQKALRAFKRLRIPDIPGTPTMEEACGEWVYPIIAALFGSYDPETKIRMIQEVFLLVPKGNSKTATFAAVMLVAIILNERPEAEFHFIAPTIAIAKYAFKQANDTINLDPELKKLFHASEHQRTITHLVSGAELLVKAADTDVITGGKPVGTMIDETHVLASKHNAPAIYVELRGALGKRPDGFLLQVTTQSKEQPMGSFASELKMARDVRDGLVKMNMLPVLYELPQRMAKDDGWRNKKYWPLLNPNMGKSVRMEFLERELTTADRKGAKELSLFASQHLNVEIGLALRNDSWSGAQFWAQRGDPSMTLDQLFERSEVVVAGIDGGGLDDLLGFAFLGREKRTRKWLHWAHAWCHRSVLDLRKEIAPKLEDLAKLKQLTIVDEVGQDVNEVCDYIEWAEDLGLLPEKGALGVDPVGISDIKDELERRQFDVSDQTQRIVGIPQGWQLNGAILTLGRKVSGREFVHGAQDLMAWTIGNAKQIPKGSAVTINKEISGKAKIDPLIATFNTVALMVRNPEAKRSVYSDRGLLVL
jgi:phage terminase large subunit-like protein